MNLYDRLRDDLKESMKDEKTNDLYPQVIEAIKKDLINNEWVDDLKYQTVLNIHSFLLKWKPTDSVRDAYLWFK